MRYGTPQHIDGVLGTPLPYTVRHDAVLTLTLLLCFVLYAVAAALWRDYIVRQLKSIFRPAHADEQDVVRPLSPLLPLLTALGCIVMGTGSLIIADRVDRDDFGFTTPLFVAAAFAVLFAAYVVVKVAVYSVVNGVFFGGKKRLQWNELFLFVSALEGALLFPMVLLLVYFNISARTALIYFAFVLFLNKMLLFYKSWCNFFQQNRLFLQNILYFCALEIAPLLAFGGAWMAVFKLLKVNF